MVEILLARRDGSEVRYRILRANQRVLFASALGNVANDALEPIDDIMQISAPLLAYAEPMYSFARVFQEICELGAVGIGVAGRHHLMNSFPFSSSSQRSVALPRPHGWSLTVSYDRATISVLPLDRD